MIAGMESNKKLSSIVSKEPYLLLVNDTTLSLGNPLRFRKNLL